MLSYIPFLALAIAGLLCLSFLTSYSGFSSKQKWVLAAGGVACAVVSFGLLYELRDVKHWLPTTLYIVTAYVCFWWFTSTVYFKRNSFTSREAALVILWGQAMFPLLMAIVLIW